MFPYTQVVHESERNARQLEEAWQFQDRHELHLRTFPWGDFAVDEDELAEPSRVLPVSRPFQHKTRVQLSWQQRQWELEHLP